MKCYQVKVNSRKHIVLRYPSEGVVQFLVKKLIPRKDIKLLSKEWKIIGKYKKLAIIKQEFILSSETINVLYAFIQILNKEK